MTPAIPPGTPIGRIETSLDWLLSHTTRFQGAILVRISRGRGLILIGYGRPAAFYFRLGNRIIQGEAARRLFAEHEFIQASLHRYTDHEFREALALVGPGARVPVPGEEEAEVPPLMAGFPGEERQRPGRTSRNRSAGHHAGHPDYFEHESVMAGAGHRGAAPLRVPAGEDLPEDILDRILTTPGVSSVAVFRDGAIVDSRGDEVLESLVEPAEEVLLSVFEVLALLSTGPLVQVTIRLLGRNVTIAPYHDGYLLVLTNPGVNLGQIRKMMHDVALAGAA
ncbi:MAG: roadblock/LC7 domain-containing protein [Methanomicrobiales archaeon]|nr:roadblock/LC7 domain-containing protein [Methanomicrobiales archaeon]NYT20736.1 roadblock/LC7 domain-containing protein [Methanomicrobiales archaeon]